MSHQMNGEATGDKWSGTPLILGAGMDLEARDDGVYIRVLIAPTEIVEDAPDDAEAGYLCDEDDPETWDPLYQKVVKRDFYKTQKYLEIANTLNERAKERDQFDAGRLANKFRSRCEALEAHDDEVQEQLRAPAVSQIISETKAVEYRRVGDDSVVSVTLEHDGKEATIDFEPGEWVNSTGDEFTVRYFGAFFEEPELEPEDWAHLKETWEAQAVDAGGDDYSEFDAVAEEIIDNLQRRIEIFDGREALDNGAYCGWYEESPSDRLYSLPDDFGPVVWIGSLALSKEVTGAGHTHKDVPQVVDHLSSEDIIRTEKKNFDGTRAYGWNAGPAGIDVSPEMVRSTDEDDGTENGHGVDL